MPQQAIDPNQLAQDKEFSAASTEDQIKYLSAQDPDFAKASPEDQRGYLAHLTGKPNAPNAGLASPAGAPPSKEQYAKTMDSGEGPIAQGMTSMENRSVDNAQGMGRMIRSSWMDKPSPNKPTMADQLLDPRNLNPVVTTEGSLARNIGATAANVLPMFIDPEGGGIGHAPITNLGRGMGSALERPARTAIRMTPILNKVGEAWRSTSPEALAHEAAMNDPMRLETSRAVQEGRAMKIPMRSLGKNPVQIPDSGVPSMRASATPKMGGRFVLTPEEAQRLEQINRIAAKRASERGMQYAGGMKPSGRKIPVP